MSVQACTVMDGAERDHTRLFNRPVGLQLHDLSRSLKLAGVDGALQASIKRDISADEDKAQYIIEQRIDNLDFFKNSLSGTRIIHQSTIDGIFAERNFPLESRPFTSRDAGDLEMLPKSNQFILNNLSEAANGSKFRAQRRFISWIIGRGALKSELVPVFFLDYTVSYSLCFHHMFGLDCNSPDPADLEI